jgi:restriction endonuclease S subunit
MKDYKIPTLNINKFSDKEFSLYSFSARDYRKLHIVNENLIKLSDLLEEKHKAGKEIGSENYMKKSKYRFLKTVNISKNYILDETSIEYCKPENKVFPKKNEILIVKDGAGDGLGEVALYPYDNSENLDSLSAGIIAINIKEEKRYYVFGLLKSNHFKNYIDLNTAQGSTIRHAKLIALDYKIPFPTTNNHQEPEKIEKLVSIITQNIIDKEEKINEKNKKIDKLIEKELQENQKSENNFKYSYPKISEIKKESRLDTGIYEKEFKEIDFLIRNYGGGFMRFKDFKISFKSGETPKNYIQKNKGSYIWVSNRDFRKNIWKSFTEINAQYVKNTVPINSILFSRRAPAGVNQVILEDHNMIVNDGIKIITSNKFDHSNVIFISLFFNSSLFQNILIQLSGGGVFGGMTNIDIENMLIPNFSDQKQQEIAKEYYNKINNNQNLNLDNYLELEKARNDQLGIFQLNMEIFTLREKLENIIDKIINDKKIDINLNY